MADDQAPAAPKQGENSPEGVAYKLWGHIRDMGDKERTAQQELELYAHCMRAVRGRSFDITHLT